MLLQTKIKKKEKRMGKKGVSIMIGYVLLITLAVVMGVITYNMLKTYIPRNAVECPDGVSLFIKNYSCQGTEFNLTLKNNGRFDIAGFLIRVGNSTEEFATRDLTQDMTKLDSGEFIANSVVIYKVGSNGLTVGGENTSVFNLASTSLTGIKLIEITPTRFQVQDNKQRFVICTNSILKDALISCELTRGGKRGA